MVEPRQKRSGSQSLSPSPSLLTLAFFLCHPLPSASTKAVAIAMNHARNVLDLTFTLSGILAYDPYKFYLYFYPNYVHILLIELTGIICVRVLLHVCEHHGKNDIVHGGITVKLVRADHCRFCRYFDPRFSLLSPGVC